MPIHHRARHGLRVLLCALLAACRSAAGPVDAEAGRALLQTAIAAHGGRERLARFDDVRIVSELTFKGQVPLRRTVDWRDSDNWSMAIDAAGGGTAMRFGMAGGQCWKKDRHLAAPCAAGDQREFRRIAAFLGARMLHHIDADAVRGDGTVEVDGIACPAIRAGEVRLAFDPRSHLLRQVALGDRVDTLSDYREIDGALIAMRRQLTIAGEPDLDETWVEVMPGGADAEAVRAPELPHPGLVVDERDPPRPVAWTEIDDPAAELAAAVDRLEDFARAHGRIPSGDSDGIVLSLPADSARERWRVAIGIEPGAALPAVAENGMQFDEWPPQRVFGVFRAGAPAGAAAERETVRELMAERDLVPASGERWQILFRRDALEGPPEQALALVRIAVDESAAEGTRWNGGGARSEGMP